MTANNLPHLQPFIQSINSGDTKIGQQVVSDSAVFHVLFGPEPLRGLDGYPHVLGMMRGAFPDINWTLQETIGEGDKMVARFETRGTHQGDFMGVAASGKRICITALNVDRFADGKIVEEKGQPDVFGLMMQIGAILPPSG